MDDLDLGQTIRGFAPGQQVFNRFTLQRVLGRGGMGVVWLARDDELERAVALKFLPDIVALDRESVTELKRETRRNLELTHPHIVRIYDFVQDAKAAAISMEFVDGSSLSAAKVDRPGGIFPVADVARWAAQLCSALSYAHGRARVVHRDLKPANLMITGAGELKVTDFGIACSIADSVSRVSKNIGSSGTPLYMSPQQMMGEKPAPSDDIYAVGATLFELLAGKPPFYTGNIILQVQGKVPVSIAARREELGAGGGEPVPPGWEEAIAGCLAKDPARRPASIAELASRLGVAGTFTPAPTAAALSPSTPAVAPAAAAPKPLPASPTAAQSARKPRRMGVWIASAAAGLAVLAAAAFWLGDGPARIEAAGKMEEARGALAGSDWPRALAAFRDARRLRPTDADYRRESDEAQAAWLARLHEEVARAEHRVAYDRLAAAAPVGELLDGSYAAAYHDLVSSRRAGVQGIVRDAMRLARSRAEAEDFTAALDALAAVRGHASLEAGYAEAEKDVRTRRLRHAVDGARSLAAEKDFAAALSLLAHVEADAALLGGQHAQAVQFVKESDVLHQLGEVRAGPYAGSADFTRGFERLDALHRAGVAVAAVEEAAAELRRRAEEFSTERLARALRAAQAAEADAAVADYARFTGSQFAVTGTQLLETKDLRAFLAALENLRMRPAPGSTRTHGRDIALIAAVRGRFSDAAAVNAFLRDELVAWSRVEEVAGRPGLALYLQDEARREGAPADAARDRRLRELLPAAVGLKVHFAPVRVDGPAGEPLRSEPARALRSAIEKRIAPMFAAADRAGPDALAIRLTINGPIASDQPKRERKSVRYQSGTRQVDNARYHQLQSQLADAQDDMATAQRGMQSAEAEAKRQAANSTDPNAALAIALAGGISVGLYQNNYNKAANRAASIRAELQDTPRTLTQPVYADEPYDHVTHNMTYVAELFAAADDMPQAMKWGAQTTHQTIEITGNKDRNVPVRAPAYPPSSTLDRQLAQQLADGIRDPSPFLLRFAGATVKRLADRAAPDPLEAASDRWALVLMWRAQNIDPDGAMKAEEYVRAALGLPKR
ncbi:MAG TPA: serine/threonine-protein kinase [Opitutaceae bacterium]|nr:serine/threonine-protein kinase [Opitutaceae bacterium]